LQTAIDETRLRVWRAQPAAFFDEAIVDRRRHAGRDHRDERVCAPVVCAIISAVRR